jgi:hypothetical protein
VGKAWGVKKKREGVGGKYVPAFFFLLFLFLLFSLPLPLHPSLPPYPHTPVCVCVYKCLLGISTLGGDKAW